MGSSNVRNESAHKGERDKEKKEKDKEDFEGTIFHINYKFVEISDLLTNVIFSFF